MIVRTHVCFPNISPRVFNALCSDDLYIVVPVTCEEVTHVLPSFLIRPGLPRVEHLPELTLIQPQHLADLLGDLGAGAARAGFVICN